MANQVYPNRVLEIKFEDQLNSYLDLMQFCTVDNSLVGVAGDIKKFRVYSATTDKTQVLGMGEGNDVAIESRYEEKSYEIQLFQNRVLFYDEEVMRDPTAIDTALKHQAVDMYNKINASIYAEFQKASTTVTVTAFDFDAFVDGTAAITDLGISERVGHEGVGLFAIAHKADVAEIRKELGDTLQYVEAFARNGYVGTVAGVNIYTSALAVQGNIIIADKNAVTFFNKVGSQVEQERVDANTRQSASYARKYGIAVLTDQSHIVRLAKSGATGTPDATLASLTIGNLTLSPLFDPNVTTYAAKTVNSTNTITVAATDSTNATAVIKNGSTTVTSGQSATWAAGDNTVKVTVTNGTQTKVYTVTVTKM